MIMHVCRVRSWGVGVVGIDSGFYLVCVTGSMVGLAVFWVCAPPNV